MSLFPLMSISRGVTRGSPMNVYRARSRAQLSQRQCSTQTRLSGHGRLLSSDDRTAVRTPVPAMRTILMDAINRKGHTSANFAQWMRHRHRLPVLGSMSPSEVFGHAAFMLSGTAFLEPEILPLRILSVAAGSATLVFAYFHPTGRPLWLPFGWNVVFMLINSAYIYKIISERRHSEQLPPQALALWRSVFAAHSLSAVDFDKLLHAGTWTTFRKGAVLQEQGCPSNSIFLIVSGGAEVFFGNKRAHLLNEHQFIGDMGLSSGISIKGPVHGVAHVETNQQTTCLVWRRQQLFEMMDGNPDINAAVRAAVMSDVVRKQCDPMRGEEQQLRAMWRARYGSILRAVFVGGTVSQIQREQLRAFRGTHMISHAEHVRLLRECGWSEQEFESGRLWGKDYLQQKPPRVIRSRTFSSNEEALALWDERNGKVALLQERLNRFFGTKALEVDGQFGPLTQQAVEIFQAQCGLRVCGRVGTATWEALRHTHRSKLEEDQLLALVRGFDEHVELDVALLQRRLQTVMGEECVKADGVYGPRTRKAVEMFLRQHSPCELSEDESFSPQAEALLRELHLTKLEDLAIEKTRAQPPNDINAIHLADEVSNTKLLQLGLKLVLGRDMVSVDGVYGPRTRKAIEEFQHTFGLPIGGDITEQLRVVLEVLRTEGPATPTRDVQTATSNRKNSAE